MAETWPPEPFDIAHARYRELDAWWTGDTGTLHEIYSGTAAARAATHSVNGKPFRGGVLGSIKKWWWGQPIPEGEERTRGHLPVAQDLCTLSTDLLFAEAPQIVFRKPQGSADDERGTDGKVKRWVHPAQDRLDKLVASDEAHAELLLAGELAAAHGGVYIAARWNMDVEQHVFPKAFAADCAIPTFIDGRLTRVRLWTEYRRGNIVYRLVEDHRPGTITYTLHEGREEVLGATVPVDKIPETEYLLQLRVPADWAVAEGSEKDSIEIGTGTNRLAVVYMKNAIPVRDWRKLGQLAHLGRSDLDGIQDLLDDIDFAWSSLMRDLENGQGRLIVAEEALDLTGTPGSGAKFDPYRQVFTAIAASLGKASDSGGPVEQVQFLIRVDEHLAIIQAAMERIASTLGYSGAHLGLDKVRGARTATEITADLSDSERTRDKKAIHARAALASYALAALEIDKAVFGGDDLGDLSTPPAVEFPPVSQEDMEKLTRIASLMEGIASMRERVRVLHPTWDEDDIGEEVEAIEAERGHVPDPAGFTGLE